LLGYENRIATYTKSIEMFAEKTAATNEKKTAFYRSEKYNKLAFSSTI
jgi:hypothetical protein